MLEEATDGYPEVKHGAWRGHNVGVRKKHVNTSARASDPGWLRSLAGSSEARYASLLPESRCFYVADPTKNNKYNNLQAIWLVHL